MFVETEYGFDPGCCRVCGVPATPVVNTLVDLDEPGEAIHRLYVCKPCVDTMAGLVGGWVPVEQLDHANRVLVDCQASEKLAREQAAAALEGLDGFVRAGKFEVTADLYNDLSPEAQEAVRTRLSKRVETAVRKQGVKADQ